MSKRNLNNKFRINDKAKNWGKVKINPAKQLADATPWRELKYGMTQQPLEGGEETEEEKAFRKMRQTNYKKAYMEEKRKEPTTWENFDDDDQDEKPALPYKRPATHLLTEQDMENFDAKKLSFAKKNHMRKVITHAVSLKHNSLKRAISNLERKQEKHKKRNPFA